MNYTLTPTFDTSYLTTQKMISYMRDLPEMSEEPIRILTIAQKNLPVQTVHTEFSKERILQKITKYTESSEKFYNLEESRAKDQCKAVSRGVLNASCLAGTGLSIGLIPNLGGAIASAVFFGAGYLVTGGINYSLENPERELSEDGMEICAGFVCGPCFAANEAINQVPERILTAREAMALNQSNVELDFKGLVALAQSENSGPLRESLNSKMNVLRAKIDTFTKSELALDPSRFDTSQTTSALLKEASSKAEQTRQQFELNLRAHETALTELNDLIQHIQQRILTSALAEAIVVNIDPTQKTSDEEVPVAIAKPVAITKPVER